MGALAMLLHLHVAIAAGSAAPDLCAPLRAQITQLLDQLAVRDAELSRLTSDTAIRSAEASTGELRIGTGASHGLQRGLESDTDFHASKRRRGEIVPGTRTHRTWPIMWNVPQQPLWYSMQPLSAERNINHAQLASCMPHAQQHASNRRREVPPSRKS
jgi:hypothetical protein